MKLNLVKNNIKEGVSLSLYKELPTEILVKFYYEIQKNIERGILSSAMYYETDLIKVEVEKRGLTLLELNQYVEKGNE